MRAFRPKGVEIYRRPKNKMYPLFAVLKSKGRSGATTRHLFSMLSEDRKQFVLNEWLQGASADISTKDTTA